MACRKLSALNTQRFSRMLPCSAGGGLLRPELAFYMFGFEALRCWKNERFWAGLDRDDKWWGVFRAFASEHALLREKVQPNQVRL